MTPTEARNRVASVLDTDIDLPGPWHMVATPKSDWYDNGKRLVTITTTGLDPLRPVPRIEAALALLENGDGTCWLCVEAGGAFEGQIDALCNALECSPTPQGQPRRIPSRPKDRQRWISTWRAVRAEAEKGKTYEAMANWLAGMHPNLACGESTLAEIVKAGWNGALD